MKNLFIATAVATGLATGALAGAADVIVTEEPAIVAPAAQATDWTGFYAGGLATSDYSGDVEFSTDGVWDGSTWPMEGTQYGAFAGYNMQYGSFVVGGELAYSSGMVNLEVETFNGFTDFIDFKARAGYPVGSLLPYVFAGYSVGTWDHSTFGGPVSSSGMNYGAGVDVMVTNSVFVGAEYIARDMTSANNPTRLPAENIAEANLQTISVRFGMKF